MNLDLTTGGHLVGRTANSLTAPVSDLKDFAKNGGSMQFIMRGHQVAFLINAKSINEAKLQNDNTVF